MERGVKLGDKESNKKRNDENINLITQISEFDISYHSKKEQLYENTYSSQLATKINMSNKKQSNHTNNLFGINFQHGYQIIQSDKNNHSKRNSISYNQRKSKTLQDTQGSVLITQQSMISKDDELSSNSESLMSQQSRQNYVNNYQINQEIINPNLLSNAQNDENKNMSCSTSSCSQINYNQNTFSVGNNSTSSNSDFHISDPHSESHHDHEIHPSSFVDLSQSFIRQQKPTFNPIDLTNSINMQNSFKAGKNRQETQEKIKRIRLRNHQSAMRGSSVKQSQQMNNDLNGGNNYAKLLKMSENSVKEKSKQAIEAIKCKLAINPQNDSVLVLKTQPQICQNDEEQYLNNSNVYQPSLTANSFNQKKKNSYVLNDQSMPFKPISQNCNRPYTSQTNKVQTNNFTMSDQKPTNVFQLSKYEANNRQKNQQTPNNLSISTLCITPNKSFSMKSNNNNLNRSIENGQFSNSENKQNSRMINNSNDENRKNLYKKMQNCNTFMRGKYAFHKLNKQKKQLCNISNVLYNSLLENYDQDGMLKTYNPLRQTTQPKKRIYDADDDEGNCENDSPDFNHMRKYYNKKYGSKLKQMENVKTDKNQYDNTAKYRNAYSHAHTPVKFHKDNANSNRNVINLVPSSSDNYKYYSQSATATNQDENQFSQIFTENLLNQSCTDFFNLCDAEEISSMLGNQICKNTDIESNQNNHHVNYILKNNNGILNNSNNNHNNNNMIQHNSKNLHSQNNAAQQIQQIAPQSRRRLASGTSKTKKKNDIEIQPWE